MLRYGNEPNDGGVDTYEAFDSAPAPGSTDMDYEGGIKMYGNETTDIGVEMYVWPAVPVFDIASTV